MPNALLIENAAIVTMDAARRILGRGYILIDDGRIAAIGDGSFAGETAAERIDAAGMVAMPGLVDTHAHAGHTLTKGLGRDSEDWMSTAGRIYAQATDAEFWGAEAALSAAERIKCGTTTAALLFGGGPDIMRTDVEAVEAHLAAIAASGVREVLAVGPNRPGLQHVYRNYMQGSYTEVEISPEAQLDVAVDLVDAAARRNDRIQVVFSLPVFDARELDSDAVYNISRRTRDLARERGVLLVQDGHRDGSIAANDAKLGLFDGRSLLAHCIDLTDEDRAVLKRTGAKVAHNPSALMSLYGRCPAPELMQEGVTVSLGTDAAMPADAAAAIAGFLAAFAAALERLADARPGDKAALAATEAAIEALHKDLAGRSLAPGASATALLEAGASVRFLADRFTIDGAWLARRFEDG